ncbi:helix-turn-helix domain-containing protein [Flavobacterium cellulosilyticum]|uniref:DNA-binding protein n=1 Tax=Flavobacterium cellulosilyticum TaxID=2541731 RepID=A0A4R5CQ21_9FLAO|nr:helix-turn-helix domain-containing protein [Flavobacterium cellulosilyticum]TDD99754.1 DNA-binding protein [Flavobacterium cellulosilyticum]
MEAIILTKDQFNDLMTKLDTIQSQLRFKADPRKEIFLDNNEFMTLLKVCKRTAQTWRDEGKISFSQVGNKIYYKLTDVEKLMQENYNKAFKSK